MIRLLILFLIFCTSGARAQYFQQRVDVHLQVRLNDVQHSLTGQATFQYTNNSRDTLTFIWFHLWPNAYKNDRTALSEQLVQHNDTRFYFSKEADRGYINQLAFEVDGKAARTETHPQYIDVTQVLLPKPLLPGGTTVITTPFHVQLPLNVSRGGHVGNSYQITQWFPKPAVYDQQGWHPMPYLDQGEFYSEWGDYRVEITLPATYVVAATGELQTKSEKEWLISRSLQPNPPPVKPVKNPKPSVKSAPAKPKVDSTVSMPEKTLLFTQKQVHDFAWFADKRFVCRFDTVQLKDRTIETGLYYLPEFQADWGNAMTYIKRAVQLHSEWIGDYPYQTVSVVQGPLPFEGGMEYPTITLIAGLRDETSIDETIFHEIGHNWFQGILASNERQFPWMDEGMNAYYDNRYRAWKAERRRQLDKQSRKQFPSGHQPASSEKLLLETVLAQQWDQPINTSSADFTPENYTVIAYFKAAAWMEMGAERMGQPLFDQCMQAYYKGWQFKHPQPGDFQQVMEATSGLDLRAWFDELNQRGPLRPTVLKKKNKLTGFVNLAETDRYQYHAIAPAPGFNGYDGLQLGLTVHNYQLPLPKWRYWMSPMVGLKSGQLNGIGDLGRHWYFSSVQSNRSLQHLAVGLTGATFTADRYTPIDANTLNLRFYKIAPYLQLHWRNVDRPDRGQRFAVIRPFFLGEDQLRFSQEIVGGDTLEVVGKELVRTQLLQLKAGWENLRALYPFRVQAEATVAADFTRVGLTTHYFFNYAKTGQGLQVRAFVGGFFYHQPRTLQKQFELSRYHLNLTGPNGQEDYTYGNYFVKRNAFEGPGSQQIMMRDGGFKVRTDLLSSKVGKTDRWLASVNLSTTIPDAVNPLNLLPFRIPLRAYLDIGSFAEAWGDQAETGRVVYNAGLQVSLLRETLHIYMPLLYSPVFRDYINSTLTENTFWKKISFSIDIHDFRLKQVIPSIPF